MSKEKNSQSISKEVSLFTSHLESLRETLPLNMMVLQEMNKHVKKDLEKFVKKYCIKEGEEDGKYLIPLDHYQEWKRKNRPVKQFRTARVLVPRSLLVTMISQYDAFLGRILKSLFLQKPELINSSEKNYTFSEVSKYPDIEAFQSYVIEKEIESILRKSHYDQFKHMEKLFNIKLTNELKIWSTFIELTERRNLFVHTDGVVSSQYIKVCKEHNYDLDQNIKEGKPLDVSQEYFENAYNCIFEIGFKLAHVLWRKVLPKQVDDADKSFNSGTFDLIEKEEYDLSCTLMDFACDNFKKLSNDYNRSILIVNRAQAHKWAGRHDECIKIMGSSDFSAKGNEFKIADTVLSEDWNACKELMLKIGSKDEMINEHSYRDWPLFKELREQPLFFEAYKDVFGKEFELNITMPEEKKEMNDASSEEESIH